MLIYEYMARGSVENNLFSRKFIHLYYVVMLRPQFRSFVLKYNQVCNEILVMSTMIILLFNFILAGVLLPLSWSIRMKIAFGAAKGLAFLHDAEKPVIYRDFKTSNILLDLVS